jgi:hypothetical protein
MGPGEAFAMITFFIAGGAVLILRGPLGKAWAERISGRREDGSDSQEEIKVLQTELDEVRHRLDEAEGRLDFAERLLSKQREAERLKGDR